VVSIGLSLVTFFADALDQSATINGCRRTPEKTLNVLDLVGGWPGGLLAQQLLRHKCSKARFLAVFWFTVAANITVLIAWHSGLLTRAMR
jgi:uncharacterized membrane protein YsdA (DUF1294 family)